MKSYFINLPNFNRHKKNMRNFEEQEEAQLFCKHSLDLSDIEVLTNQLATKLKLNIEYNAVQNGVTLQNTIIGNASSEVVSNLFCNNNESLEYVLEIGNAALLISKEIIVYALPSNEIFRSLQKVHKNESNGLHATGYFRLIFEELAALGATEVLFAEENEAIRSLKVPTYTYEAYSAIIKESTNYFTEPTQIKAVTS